MGQSDCEHIGAGLLAQPTNTVSSLAFVICGLWLVGTSVRHQRRESILLIVYGFTMATVGLGSFAFHGPMPRGTQLVHDASVAALLLLVAVVALGASEGWDDRRVLTIFGLGAGIATALLGIFPQASNAVLAAVFVAATASEARRLTGRQSNPGWGGRIRLYWIVVALVAMAVIVNTIGRTGGLLCEPTSLLQWHAVWHVFTAAALGIYGYHVVGNVKPTDNRIPSQRSS